YSLRRRYQPQWLPQWPEYGMRSIFFEQSWPHLTGMVIDAYRRENASLVAIKCRPTARIENELAIHRFLTSREMLQDPQNHCAPVLDVFHNPDALDMRGRRSLTFLVTPFLYDLEQWPFQTVDNALDFVGQTLEAIAFMHAHGVAHRDCAGSNIRVDASGLYPDHWPHPAMPTMDYCSPWSPLHSPERASASVRFYLIDFSESSRVYDDHDGPFLVTGNRCIDPALPEAYFDHPYDPFPVDVFLLGNTYRQSLFE
ncbi:hypothetical protein EXIGLDRAFT_581555, partial [Exidia glandulosa HHB12029]